MKILYFDTETTGLDPVVNDIIQLAGMIEIDGNIKHTFKYHIQPFNWKAVNDEALKVNGLKIEDIEQYSEPKDVYLDFVAMLGRFVDKFDKADKFYMAGYNVEFDLQFLLQFFSKNGDKYFGSWFNYKKVDPLPILHLFEAFGGLQLENMKLETVCKHFKIEIDAHDAMSDIFATKQLLDRIKGKFFS